MYKPNDVEILEAYDDFLSETLKIDHAFNGSKIWMEAFKRGMRFNSNDSQQAVEANAESWCEYDHSLLKSRGARYCENCLQDFHTT